MEIIDRLDVATMAMRGDGGTASEAAEALLRHLSQFLIEAMSEAMSGRPLEEWPTTAWRALVILNASDPRLTCVLDPHGMTPTHICDRHDLPRALVEAVALFVMSGLNELAELAPAASVAVNRALSAGGQLIVLVDPVAVLLDLVLMPVSGEPIVLASFGHQRVH